MKHVVIIGGGYGGVASMRRLARDKSIQVTLIDQNPYHFLQTEGYELVAGISPFDKTVVNLQTLCASYREGVHFLQRKVVGINFDRKTISCREGEALSYDFLVIAAGSQTRFFKSIEGLRACSHGIKNLQGAFKMKQFFEKELFLRLKSPKETSVHYSVLIGGAGLSGVEIAAEMQYYFNRYYHSNTMACNLLNIHLISGSSTILKGMHPSIIKKASTRLKTLGVQLHCGNHIERVETNRAYLEGGESIAFDFMIFTGGIVATPIVENMEIEHNHLGQIVVDSYLRVPDKEGVFAIGDAVQTLDKEGNILPDTAQIAIKSGHFVSHSIKRIINKHPPHINRIKIRGVAIALGGRYAILDIGIIRIYGSLGYFVKKIVERLYKYPLWLRCRYGFKKIKSCQI